MCGGGEDLLDEGIDPPENRQIQDLGALLIQVGHQFPVLGHLSSPSLESPSLEEPPTPSHPIDGSNPPASDALSFYFHFHCSANPT